MAEENPNVTFIGMGAQDSLAFAEDFIANTNTGGIDNLTMIWDESFDTWSHYNVRSQPTLIIVDADGNFVEGWNGLAPFDKIEEIIKK